MNNVPKPDKTTYDSPHMSLFISTIYAAGRAHQERPCPITSSARRSAQNERKSLLPLGAYCVVSTYIYIYIYIVVYCI